MAHIGIPHMCRMRYHAVLPPGSSHAFTAAITHGCCPSPFLFIISPTSFTISLCCTCKRSHRRVLCSCGFLHNMDRASGSGKANVRAEYLRFFEALGVVEPANIHTLERLLHTFFEVAMQLDSHLASVGATLHAAVSRMTEMDNPAAPPRHRWIRIIDRLGFFPDHDQHAKRIIKMRLAYAYRHKEVDLVTAANALHLLSQRVPCTCNGGSGTGATSPEVVPLGGIAVPRTSKLARARPPVKVVAVTPNAGARGTPAPHFTSASVGSSEAGAGADADADDILVLPPGELIVPRPGA